MQACSPIKIFYGYVDDPLPNNVNTAIRMLFVAIVCIYPTTFGLCGAIRTILFCLVCGPLEKKTKKNESRYVPETRAPPKKPKVNEGDNDIVTVLDIVETRYNLIVDCTQM